MYAAGDARPRSRLCAGVDAGRAALSLHLTSQPRDLVAGPINHLMVRVGEGLDAFYLKLLRHLAHLNAGVGEAAHRLVRGGEGVATVQRTLGHAVILERLNGRRRHRVHRLRPDQLLDVEHVAIAGILGAGAGPEAALWRRAPLAQHREAVAVEEPLVRLVGDARVGDGRRAEQRAQLLFPGIVTLRVNALLQLLVHQRIHAADEEAGDGGDARDKLAVGLAVAQPANERFGDLLVDFQ